LYSSIQGSVEGVALRRQNKFLGGVKPSPTGATTCRNGFGASDSRGRCKQLIELSFGEGIGQDEGPVLHATSAKHDGGQDFTDSGGRLVATHVGAGAVGACDSGHGIRG
jgi:hypothetical protein